MIGGREVDPTCVTDPPRAEINGKDIWESCHRMAGRGYIRWPRLFAMARHVLRFEASVHHHLLTADWSKICAGC